MEENYLNSVKKLFAYYKTIADKSIAQVTEEQLFYTSDADNNSMANVMQHLSGNMLSRFTDFLTTDGEKPNRNRDAEFDLLQISKTELLENWEQGWKTMTDCLDNLQASDLQKVVYIRNEGHTVVEAINRQLAHYPYHVGQIVVLAKSFCKSNWQSLSIPKNKSDEYNKAKFANEKKIQNFTDNELLNLNKKCEN